jgi:hypothetical protein
MSRFSLEATLSRFPLDLCSWGYCDIAKESVTIAVSPKGKRDKRRCPMSATAVTATVLSRPRLPADALQLLPVRGAVHIKSRGPASLSRGDRNRVDHPRQIIVERGDPSSRTRCRGVLRREQGEDQAVSLVGPLSPVLAPDALRRDGGLLGLRGGI